MKTKIVLAGIIMMTLGLVEGYSQINPNIDDKILVMKEIEGLPERSVHPLKEFWKKAREVEDVSLLFGYSSYGAPWGTPSLHGGTLGASLKHVMVNLDFGLGSMIDENAYGNKDAYDYLRAKSTQSFGFMSVHYYLIKYLSFGIGLGAVSELQKVESPQIDTYSNFNIENDKISFENKWFYGVRLGAKAYIPIPEKQLSIYLSGNYDIVPSNKSISSFGLGIGLKINME